MKCKHKSIRYCAPMHGYPMLLRLWCKDCGALYDRPFLKSGMLGKAPRWIKPRAAK